MAGGTRSYEMARQLIDRGHEVTMVCVKQGKDGLDLHGNPKDPVRKGDIDGIRVIQFNLEYSNYMSLLQRALIFFRFALRSVWLALRMDYDLVFATSTPLTAGIPGIFARFFRGKPFIFEVRDLWPELPRAMGVVRNPFVLARHVSSWNGELPGCVSMHCAFPRHQGRHCTSQSQRTRTVAIIPNGCDLDLFRPGRREDLDLPGVRPTDCVAVFTGAHGIANGLDAVLDAAGVLLRRGRKDIVLVFIGDGKLKPALTARATVGRFGELSFFRSHAEKSAQSCGELLRCRIDDSG